MRLTIQLDSQAAKIRAAQAARVCSSGCLPSQSRAMVSCSFMGAPAEKGGVRGRPNGGTLANSRPPVRYRRDQRMNSRLIDLNSSVPARSIHSNATISRETICAPAWRMRVSANALSEARRELTASSTTNT